MSADLVLSQFDLFSEAPNAIPRLRHFIAELAMRGRLTEQDHQDEPASQLLERLLKHKEKLVKEGLLKHYKHVGADFENHLSFDTPSGWTVTTLGDVAHKITDGTHKTPHYVPKGVPFVCVKDFSGGRLDFSNTRFITHAEHEALYKRCDPKPGDILIGRIGTLGKAVLVDTDAEFSLFVSVGLIRFSHKFIAPDFLRLFLNSPIAESEYDRIKVGGGTHTNKLNLGDLHTLFFPLPPLAEQHRIVDKVKKLMLLCDGLEAEQGKRELQRTQFTSATLNSLTNGAEPDGFQEHARFCIDHVPDITSHPEQILSLRRAILSLAVRGRLVPQESADEAVTESLKLNDHARAVTAKDDHRADGDNQILLAAQERWEVPKSWEWRGLADLALFIDYRGKTPTKVESGIRLITAKNVRRGIINFFPEEFLAESNYDKWMTRGLPQEGDVLFTTEAPMGNAAVVRLEEKFALAQRVICFRLYGALDPDFLVLQLLSDPFQTVLEKTATGLTAKGIKAAKLKRLPIAIPPPAEQKRIVARVRELMNLCDALEARLGDSQVEKSRLLESVLYHALADAPAPAALTTPASSHVHFGLKPVATGTRVE